MSNLFHKSLSFEPVQDEDDELLNAINNDPHEHDNVWELKDDIDPDKLTTFWDKTLHDLEPDNESDS